VITLVWDECGRSALLAASAAEVHSIPDIHAAVSDEFGATYVYSGAFGRLGHAQPGIDGTMWSETFHWWHDEKCQ
jgi:hypothetical protein